MIEEGFVKAEEVANVKFIDTYEEMTAYIDSLNKK